jgi:hypothetical protein
LAHRTDADIHSPIRSFGAKRVQVIDIVMNVDKKTTLSMIAPFVHLLRPPRKPTGAAIRISRGSFNPPIVWPVPGADPRKARAETDARSGPADGFSRDQRPTDTCDEKIGTRLPDGRRLTLHTRRPQNPLELPDASRRYTAPRVLAALSPEWRPLFATAFFLGLRRGELLALLKEDITCAIGPSRCAARERQT